MCPPFLLHLESSQHSPSCHQLLHGRGWRDAVAFQSAILVSSLVDALNAIHAEH